MSRRQARESALQVLFQVDMGGLDPKEAFLRMGENFNLAAGDDFTQRLVNGTLENLSAIDQVIEVVSSDWNLKRMANVDRNIMRLALFEVFYCEDIPDNVSVNEAIELGKIFGGADSGRFINGILGKVLENPGQYRPGNARDVT